MGMVLGFVLVPIAFCAVSAMVAARSDLRTGLTVLFSMPVVMYASVVLVREWVLESYATLPLVMSIASKHKQFLKLHERRCALVAMAKSIVSRYDEELHNQLAEYTRGAAGTAATRQASLFS